MTAVEAGAAAEIANELLPGNNPARLGTSSSAHISAVAAYECADQPSKAAEHLAATARDAEKLAHIVGNPTAMLYGYDADEVIDGLEGKLDRTAEFRAA